METPNEDKPKSFKDLFKSFSKEPKEEEIPQFKGTSEAKDLDIRFAENFTANSGKFVYCQSLKDFFNLLGSLQKENAWNHVFCWNPAIKKLMVDAEFQTTTIGFFMDNSDSAISGCYGLLADEGLIMLTPNQATNRRLTTFPPNHIIIASKDNLFPNLETAIKSFKGDFDDKLPSLIELVEDRPVCRANHSRLLNADGTPNVFVFYIDIPDLG